MKKALYTVLLAVLPWIAAAQGVSVSGRVVDAQSGAPLESVLVSSGSGGPSTVTNADGDFTLKSESSMSSLSFSYMGYSTVKLAPGDGPLKVKMQRQSFAIPGARIVSGDPDEIVRAARELIPDNYSPEMESLLCFYRETVRKRQKFVYVSEAVARLNKTAYSQNVFSDRAALVKSRVLVSQKKSDTLRVKMLGGPTQALEFDVVKNPEILLKEEELQNYRLEIDKPEFIDGRAQFVIRIIPDANPRWPLYYGTLYIDQERMSFTRMELSLDMSDPSKVSAAILRKKPAGLHFKPQEVSLVLNYHTEDGVTRLSYFKNTMRFACDSKKRLISTTFTTVNELVVTERLVPTVPINRTEMFHSGDALGDKTALFADPAFWDDYNIIEPSESLEHAIGRLKVVRN